MPNPDVEDIVYAERYLGRKGEPLTAIGVYQPGVLYPKGVIVIDRGGLWFSLVKTSTRPISGNTNWLLVAGTPYVDVVVTPPELVSAPYFSSPASDPGVEVIPAPGVGLMVQMRYSIYTTSGPGDAWSSTSNPRFYYGNPATGINAYGGVNAEDQLTTDATLIGRQGLSVAAGVSVILADPEPAIPPGVENQPIVMQSNQVITGGTRSLFIRVWYDIVPADLGTGVPVATFFLITAVNQGTKTLTVSPDPTAIVQPGDTITIVGSTGNNQPFIVASRDATHIVVTQAIPDGTADGWVRVP